jgi:hypothetical protein
MNADLNDLMKDVDNYYSAVQEQINDSNYELASHYCMKLRDAVFALNSELHRLQENM